VKFTNAAKKSHFEIYSSVKYSSKSVKSIGDTISAVIPAGYSAGDREELWTGGYTGTYYVYEWKQIS
jgi:Zn-dependent oligopeptidase